MNKTTAYTIIKIVFLKIVQQSLLQLLGDGGGA